MDRASAADDRQVNLDGDFPQPISNSRPVTCPGCGESVMIPLTGAAPGGGSPQSSDARVAHALCGCYLFAMPEASFNRLLDAIFISPRPISGGEA